MLENQIMNLMSALNKDQQLATVSEVDVEAENATKFKTYNLGQFIYSISLENSLVGGPKCTVHMQWPRLYRWAMQAKQEGKRLAWEHSVVGPNTIGIRVQVIDKPISYKVLLDRYELITLLVKSKCDPDVCYSMPIEDLWNLVCAHEHL